MSDPLSVFLVVLGMQDNGYFRGRIATPFPTMEACLKSAETSKVAVATGGDAEAGVVLYCTYGDPKDRSGCQKANSASVSEPWPCELREWK